MRLVHDPGDHVHYPATRDRLARLIVAWAGRRGLPVRPALVELALDVKHGIDGRLGHWTRGHVADVLAVRFPRRIALPAADRDAVPAALHAVVGLLADRGWLDARSAPPAALHAQIDASTPALNDALGDERNHDLGTFWAAQLLRHGVPAADPAAVARFLERVRAGEVPIDRAALAEVTRREAAGPEAQRSTAPALAPVLLPDAGRLHADAAACPAVLRLRTFVRWLGPGTPLDGGRLPLPDARALSILMELDGPYRDTARTGGELPEIGLLLHWARQADLVCVQRGRLVPAAGEPPDPPLELWWRAFDALGRLGEHFGGTDVFGAPSLFGMPLAEAFPLLCRTLYGAGGAAVSIELFHRRVRDAVAARFGCRAEGLAGDVEQRQWRRDVSALLDALELLGAVHVGESLDGAELARIAGLAGRADPDPTLVSLTGLGLWGARAQLLREGVTAPLVGELVDEDVEYVCLRLSAAAPAAAEAELTAWVAARDPRVAADELARFLARTDEPAHRALALTALGTVVDERGRDAALPPRRRGSRLDHGGRHAARPSRRAVAHPR